MVLPLYKGEKKKTIERGNVYDRHSKNRGRHKTEVR